MKKEPKNLKEWIQLYTDKYDHLSNQEILNKKSLKLYSLNIQEMSLFLNNFYGTLDLSNNQIKEIPAKFKQNGNLYLNNNHIKEIPANFKQNRTLDLSYNQIKEIPLNFKQNGDLLLYHNQIKEIPAKFKQYGILDLSNNEIKEILDKFKQNGDLYLHNNKIEKIHSPKLLNKKTLSSIIHNHKNYIEKRNKKDSFISSLNRH